MHVRLLSRAMLVGWVAAGCAASDGIDELTGSGTGTGGASTSSGNTTGPGSTGAGGNACPPVPTCDAALPGFGPAVSWNDALTPVLVTSQGAPQHRGRDLFLGPGEPQWVLAKFAYGPVDKDLKGEAIDIYLLRDCGSSWELFGSATTTQEGEHATVEGVDDTGGRIYFQIPAEEALAPGRHRLHLVVRGDLSSTDVFVEVRAAGTPMFVSDVDGTLTTGETEEFTTLLAGQLPNANPDASQALTLLASKGVRPFYLTARPEWLTGRTREFLDTNGFPPGIVHTTLSAIGAQGSSAVTYKSGELATLAARGLHPSWAFGNTATDAEAYNDANMQPMSQRVFFQFDDAFGGRRIEAWAELLGEIGALPPQCP